MKDYNGELRISINDAKDKCIKKHGKLPSPGKQEIIVSGNEYVISLCNSESGEYSVDYLFFHW